MQFIAPTSHSIASSFDRIALGAKGRTRTGLFVGVLFGPFRAQIFSIVFVGVGHFLCLFVLVVAPVVALMREVVCLRS